MIRKFCAPSTRLLQPFLRLATADTYPNEVSGIEDGKQQKNLEAKYVS